MLAELNVKNLALIDSLQITFGPGANILTGETGAGKSILVGALNLLRGQKVNADFLRAGADEAWVAALFYLDRPQDFTPIFTSLAIEATDEILLKRVLTATGRTRAYLNGSPISQGQLAMLGEALLSISGQHDQQTLLKSSNQLDYLDRFLSHPEVLTEMREAWQTYAHATQSLKVLTDRLKDVSEKKDLYQFQLEEIQKVRPQKDEDDALLAEKNSSKNSGRLLENLATAAEILGSEPGNIVEKLGKVRRQLELAAALDPNFNAPWEEVDSAYHSLADLAAGLEAQSRNLEVDPGRLDWLEERLNTLAKLKRKYQLSLNDIIARENELRQLLDELDSSALDLARLTRRRQEALSQALDKAHTLHLARQEAGERLATDLTANLKPLGFPKIEIKVALEAPESDPELGASKLGPQGYDSATFLFSPNPGEGLKPLAKIASGGELSRLMLALKTVQNRPSDQLLVFDEIDSGLGGITAEAVAAKVAALACEQQIVVITHLPTMAALAGQHYLVRKESAQDRTITTIIALSASERTAELARMLGGAAPTPEAIALAKQLLNI